MDNHKCGFAGCGFVANEGELDKGHIYCPGHTDGTMIHFNARSPWFWGGVCGKCGFRVGWKPNADQTLYLMVKETARRILHHWVPMEQVAEVLNAGWEYAHKHPSGGR